MIDGVNSFSDEATGLLEHEAAAPSKTSLAYLDIPFLRFSERAGWPPQKVCGGPTSIVS
jgi:hypothetical protein